MEKFEYYEREINYYETDKMAVVHHSNYARYLEECRIKMLQHYGMPMEMFEEMGYMIPVLELHGEFKESIRFGETIKIVAKIEKVTPLRFYFDYVIYDETMTHIKHKAKTSHCFINSKFQPVSMKKEAPELYEKFLAIVEKGDDNVK